MTGGPWNYVYDGNGLRVEKSNASGGTLYWRAITGETIAETDLTGSTTNTAYREYIFFAGRRIASRDSATPTPNVYFYYTDHLGSTTAITTATGTVCYQASFTPYGEEHLAQTTMCPQNYKFTGYERDLETGLDYAFARYYDSRLGRFMSADPLGGDSTDPQSLNRYAYVGNSPPNFIDPSGMNKCPAGETEGPDGKCIITVSTWQPLPPPPAPPSGYGGDPGGDNGGGDCGGAPCPPGTQGTGGGGGPAKKKTKTKPCAGIKAADLIYTPDARAHITSGHIDPVPEPNNSHYMFSSPTTPDEQFSIVQAFNAFTFNPAGARMSGGNIVMYTVIWPGTPFNVPGLGVVTPAPYVGTDNVFNGHMNTNVNTLVLQSDCRTVITSHPGLPNELL